MEFVVDNFVSLWICLGTEEAVMLLVDSFGCVCSSFSGVDYLVQGINLYFYVLIVLVKWLFSLCFQICLFQQFIAFLVVHHWD